MSEIEVKAGTRERPILFSAPMVRAILEGRKTQTRRVIKPQPVVPDHARELFVVGDQVVYRPIHSGPCMGSGGYHGLCKAKYRVGDRLWVKETIWRSLGKDRIAYVADEPILPIWGLKKVSSIHMPRAASRITLDVTGLRVERLQDITEADAVAEGVTETFDGPGGCHERTTAAENFRHLWESINGSASWAENPWVWVVEFQRQ